MPARASSTASAVPNEPAPITAARRNAGVGSERARAARDPVLAVGSGADILMSEPSGTQTALPPTRRTPRLRFSNWTGDQSCEPVAWERPAGVAQLQEALGRAADAGLAVRAV